MSKEKLYFTVKITETADWDSQIADMVTGYIDREDVEAFKKEIKQILEKLKKDTT